MARRGRRPAPTPSRSVTGRSGRPTSRSASRRSRCSAAACSPLRRRAAGSAGAACAGPGGCRPGPGARRLAPARRAERVRSSRPARSRPQLPARAPSLGRRAGRRRRRSAWLFGGWPALAAAAVLAGCAPGGRCPRAGSRSLRPRFRRVPVLWGCSGPTACRPRSPAVIVPATRGPGRAALVGLVCWSPRCCADDRRAEADAASDARGHRGRADPQLDAHAGRLPGLGPGAARRRRRAGRGRQPQQRRHARRRPPALRRPGAHRRSRSAAPSATRRVRPGTAEWICWIDSDMVLPPQHAARRARRRRRGRRARRRGARGQRRARLLDGVPRAGTQPATSTSTALHNPRLLRRDLFAELGGFDADDGRPGGHRPAAAAAAAASASDALPDVLIVHDEGRLTLRGGVGQARLLRSQPAGPGVRARAARWPAGRGSCCGLLAPPAAAAAAIRSCRSGSSSCELVDAAGYLSATARGAAMVERHVAWVSLADQRPGREQYWLTAHARIPAAPCWPAARRCRCRAGASTRRGRLPAAGASLRRGRRRWPGCPGCPPAARRRRLGRLAGVLLAGDRAGGPRRARPAPALRQAVVTWENDPRQPLYRLPPYRPRAARTRWPPPTCSCAWSTARPTTCGCSACRRGRLAVVRPGVDLDRFRPPPRAGGRRR